MNVKATVAEAIETAKRSTDSRDELVQLAWLIDGLCHWYETNGNVGNSPDQTKTYILSRFARLSHSVGDAE